MCIRDSHLSDRLRNLLSQDGLEEEVRRAATALQSKICLPSEVRESPSKQKEMLTCQAVATERVDLLGESCNALVEERPLISLDSRPQGFQGDQVEVPRGFGTTLSSIRYDSLPNPIYDLLRRLPVVDGLDLDQLVKFFEGVFGIYDFPGVTGASLLNMIYPYCRAPLLDRVVWHLGAGGDFDTFHRDVLELFMPGRLHDQMRQRLFYRVQGHGEKLNVFITSIKSAARVLRVDVSEAEVVRVILEGLNPQERSRLVFLELSLIHI